MITHNNEIAQLADRIVPVSYTLLGEYSDEGFSGKNIQGRHEFQQMLRDVQDCKDGVSYVLVFKLSRFGRDVYKRQIHAEELSIIFRFIY